MDMRFLMKQAQQMQTKLQEAQQALRVEGTAGGAMVKITLNGAKELVAVAIAKEAMDPEDPSMLEDLIMAAFKDAAVKAEADICCTSANAAAVARSLAVRRLILVPDRQLAADVERETGIEVVSSGGQCGVQARFSGKEIADYRREHRAVVLAHPGCSEETRRSANFVGSSAAMTRYLRLVRPDRVLLLGDCSMADEVKLDNPEVEFLEPCNLCIFMQAVTPPSVARVLEDGCNEIDVEPEIAQRALRAISRMLAL